ncbi:MAG: helix-turn-helix domain-containing protein [Candidatus Bathyarchaeia archaeon]
MMPAFEDLARKLISSGISEEISNRLIEEYSEVKKEYILGNYEEVIKHAGKFSEVILALIKNKVLRENVNLDKLGFNELYKELEDCQKTCAKEEILTLAVPRVARSVYTIRSKKDVVHIKTVDPNFVDAVYCMTACDWMLSQIALLLLEIDEKEVCNLVDSVLKKRIPIIEEFEDGSITILKEGLTTSDEILLALYHYYPKRLSGSELAKILKVRSQTVHVNLQRLEKKRLIHKTEKGAKLTLLGIKHIEENLLR